MSIRIKILDESLFLIFVFNNLKSSKFMIFILLESLFKTMFFFKVFFVSLSISIPYPDAMIAHQPCVSDLRQIPHFPTIQCKRLYAPQSDNIEGKVAESTRSQVR